MTEREDPRSTRRELLQAAVVVVAGVSLGCDPGPAGPGPDGSVRDGGAGDGGPGGPDAAGLDAGPPDGGPSDAGPPDAGPPPIEPPEGVPEAVIATFPLGVASGDATSERAIFWARYAGSAELALVVWEMDGERYARTVHDAVASPSDGGFVAVDVAGLAPGAWHRYAFFETEGGERTARSPIGRMRAAPPVDALVPLRIGACSCTDNDRVADTLSRAGERDDLDLFLYLGDTTYNDGARTLVDYRGKWAQSLSRAGYRAARAATSALATWDDHEFDNDWNPESFDAAQKAAAVQTFFEHQPLRRDAAFPDRVWKSMRWGRTAEIFVLDCRSERRPSTRSGADAEYLSRAQMDWLKAGLAASDAVFKIIVNSVPIADFPGAFDLAQNDRWEGYPAARREILEHVDGEGITGVLWVAGDFHLASAQRVSTSGPGSTQREVLVGPGAQNGNLLARFLGGEQFDFATTENNYSVIELEPAMGRARIWWIDGSASTIETREYPLV